MKILGTSSGGIFVSVANKQDVSALKSLNIKNTITSGIIVFLELYPNDDKTVVLLRLMEDERKVNFLETSIHLTDFITPENYTLFDNLVFAGGVVVCRANTLLFKCQNDLNKFHDFVNKILSLNINCYRYQIDNCTTFTSIHNLSLSNIKTKILYIKNCVFNKVESTFETVYIEHSTVYNLSCASKVECVNIKNTEITHTNVHTTTLAFNEKLHTNAHNILNNSHYNNLSLEYIDENDLTSFLERSKISCELPSPKGQWLPDLSSLHR